MGSEMCIRDSHLAGDTVVVLSSFFFSSINPDVGASIFNGVCGRSSVSVVMFNNCHWDFRTSFADDLPFCAIRLSVFPSIDHKVGSIAFARCYFSSSFILWCSVPSYPERGMHAWFRTGTTARGSVRRWQERFNKEARNEYRPVTSVI